MATTTNSFPRWHDGNVEIYLTEQDEPLLLHSHTLALHSTWFKAALSERWNGEGRDGTMLGSGILGGHGYLVGAVAPQRWAFELRFEEGSDMGLLERRKDQRTTGSTTTEMQLCSDEIATKRLKGTAKTVDRRRRRVVEAHRGWLQTIYHVEPAFLASGFYPLVMQQFAHVARVYGCEAVTKTHIDHWLANKKAKSESRCFELPLQMLELGLAVRSGSLFREAAAHITGQSNEVWQSSKSKIQELGCAALMDTKREEFVKKLSEVDKALLLLLPAVNNDWAGNIAISMFRQWLLEEFTAGRMQGLSDSCTSTYLTIRDTLELEHFKRLPAFDMARMELYVKGKVTTKDHFAVQEHLDNIFPRLARL